jgi:aspartate carbamoyltransferase catalytic subunit
MPLQTRLRRLIWAQYGSTSKPTQTQIDAYSILKAELSPMLEKLKKIALEDLKNLEKELEKAGAPWTPGRIPQLK